MLFTEKCYSSTNKLEQSIDLEREVNLNRLEKSQRNVMSMFNVFQYVSMVSHPIEPTLRAVWRRTTRK